MTVPTFLVAGAARAGTTALVEGLRLHPDVFVTQPKEPHYFAFHGLDVACTGPGDDRWFNRVVVSDRERYLALFDDAGTASARGDGSVTTLYHADKAVPEILRINPSMRVVIILREPVERAFSSFTYLRLRGVETEVDFRRALDLEAKRRVDGWHHMWHYSAMSLYADDLRTIVDGLGRSQVKVWFYDELTSNFQRVLDEVVAFIGLPAFHGRTRTVPRVNVSGTAKSDVVQSMIAWATRTELARSALKRVIPFSVRERARSLAVRTEAVPAIDMHELTDRFADDMCEVAQLVPGPHPEWLRRFVRRPTEH